MNKKGYKKLFKKYLDLRAKVQSGAQVRASGQSYNVKSSNFDTDELIKVRGEMGGCLECFAVDELLEIYSDPVIGPKAGAILDRKMRKTNLTFSHSQECENVVK